MKKDKIIKGVMVTKKELKELGFPECEGTEIFSDDNEESFEHLF